MACGVDGDSIDSIDGSDHRYLPRDRKSYVLPKPMGDMMPTYKDCQEGFRSLVDCVEDLDSPTFRDIWFQCARQLRQKGCWRECSNLMKVAHSHDVGLNVNPKSFIGHLYRINRYSTNNRYSSNVLEEEDKQC